MPHLQHVNMIAIGKNGKNKDSLIVYLEKVESHYFLSNLQISFHQGLVGLGE